VPGQAQNSLQTLQRHQNNLTDIGGSYEFGPVSEIEESGKKHMKREKVIMCSSDIFSRVLQTQKAQIISLKIFLIPCPNIK